MTQAIRREPRARPPGSPVASLFEPQLLMTIDGALTDILDLTDPATQTALRTTSKELTAPWLIQQAKHLAGQGPAPATQVLGREAYGSGTIVGLRYSSSKNPKDFGVIVFTTRLTLTRHSLQGVQRARGCAAAVAVVSSTQHRGRHYGPKSRCTRSRHVRLTVKRTPSRSTTSASP